MLKTMEQSHTSPGAADLPGSQTASLPEALGESLSSRPVVMRASGLCKSFGGQNVLNDVDLELRRGEVVVLRGDNGSGKTTLLNILTGCLEPDSGRIDMDMDGTRERFVFPRPWWKELNPFDHFTPERVAVEGVGRSWQDVRLFDTLDLRDNVATAVPGQLGEMPLWPLVRRGAVARQERSVRRRASELLSEFGLGDRQTSSANRISLGQSKRVAFARALGADAGVLFLDEPLAGLDQEGVEQVLSLLRSLARHRQVTLVIIEHVFHIPRLLEFADTVWTLRDGRLGVEDARTVGRGGGGEAGNVGVVDWICGLAGDEVEVVREPLIGGATLTRVRPAGQDQGASVLEVDGVVIHRKARRVIGQRKNGHIEGLSFEVREGEIAILEAPNGWGKTTLLDAISGVLETQGGRVAQGAIRYRGENLRYRPIWQRVRDGISYLRARDHVFPGLTVSESLRMAGVVETPENLTDLADRLVSSLSGGEKQRLAIAVAADGDAKLRLMDEPISALDIEFTEGLGRVLVTRLRSGDESILISLPAESRG